MKTVDAIRSKQRPHSSLRVVAICCAAIVFDGYDLIVYGAVLPKLLDEPGWGLGPAEAGAIGSYALVGMVVGAVTAGALSDLIGRRSVIMISVSWFSLAMAGCALAPSPEFLGLFRFLAGIGLGAVMPSAVALTVEYAPAARRQLYNAMMFTGYSVGGVLAAVLALTLVDDQGWRVMFWIGAAALAVVLPLVAAFLPESASFLLAKGRRVEAEALARRYGLELDREATDDAPAREGRTPGFTLLFRRAHLRPTLLFGAASFCGLLLVFGLNTWLPVLMRQAGYPLGSALQFLVALNVGAIVGTVLLSLLADRFGSRPVIAVAFLAAAACLAALSVSAGPTALLLSLVAVAGLGSVGVQILINGFVAVFYPAGSRASALGWTLSAGRVGGILGPLIGGWILTSELGFRWNFYVFAVVAVLGCVVIIGIPAAGRESTAAGPAEPTSNDRLTTRRASG